MVLARSSAKYRSPCDLNLAYLNQRAHDQTIQRREVVLQDSDVVLDPENRFLRCHVKLLPCLEGHQETGVSVELIAPAEERPPQQERYGYAADMQEASGMR